MTTTPCTLDQFLAATRATIRSQRVTGGDVERQQTLRFEVGTRTVTIEDRARRR